MILSDRDIRARLARGPRSMRDDAGNAVDLTLAITPLDLDVQIQPASVDLRLGNEFVISTPMLAGGFIDPTKPIPDDASRRVVFGDDDEFVIKPGEFVLGTTLERVRIPADLAARVEGRSSIGRLGITVHVTAGFIDPGFEGQITLEIANLSPNHVRLVPGMRVAQLVLHTMTRPSAKPYQGKYQGQSGTTQSRSSRDFEHPLGARVRDMVDERLRLRLAEFVSTPVVSDTRSRMTKIASDTLIEVWNEFGKPKLVAFENEEEIRAAAEAILASMFTTDPYPVTLKITYPPAS